MALTEDRQDSHVEELIDVESHDEAVEEIDAASNDDRVVDVVSSDDKDTVTSDVTEISISREGSSDSNAGEARATKKQKTNKGPKSKVRRDCERARKRGMSDQ